MEAVRAVPGIEVLAGREARLVRGRRVALLAHAASVSRELVPAWRLLEAAGARIESVLAPEHGLFGEAQDMEAVEAGTIRIGGREVPLRSLYGSDAASLAPKAEDLAGAEVLVVDLADVGARYYTFAATADIAARSCLEAGIDVIVADRPNPLGGAIHEGGPGIGAAYRSFVGHFDVPQRHALTLGELVRGGADRDGMRVVPAEGWSRDEDHERAGLPWVAPSPNIPCPETALVYPGACLVEGTNLSEGRGTTRPFETVGAPFIDGEDLARLIEPLGLAGALLRPVRFRPTFHKHSGVVCSGVFVHVTDRERFRPLRTYLAILWAAARLSGERMCWRSDAYEFRDDVPAIDLLWGGPRLREAIDSGGAAADVMALPDAAEREWIDRRDGFHLY